MPLILGTNSIKDTGYDVDNSLRFNSGSDDHLDKTFGQAGNRRTFTVSFWIKTTTKETYNAIFDSAQDGSNSDDLYFHTGRLNFSGYYGSTQFALRTTAKFRDPSAWSHHVIAFDTTQGTASNRIKFFTNGVQETVFDDETYPSQNFQTSYMNTARLHNIGTLVDNDGFPLDGYLAEFVFIDGQALAPDQFGEFDEDSGIWKPIDVSGLTFGTNGFYLDFENSGSLGADVSGNGNNFTVNNLTAIDQSISTPTNIFATMNPLVPTTSLNFSDGNLTLTGTNATNYSSNNTSTFGVSSGKWYVEVEFDTAGSNTSPIIGISPISISPTTNPTGSVTDVINVTMNNELYVEGTNSASYLGSTPTAGDIIQIALDMDNGKVFFGLNGTFVGDPVSGSGGAFSGITSGETIGIMLRPLNAVFKANFGSPPYTISSGNSDGNGYGNFEYAVPSGYYALNTKNLAEYG